MMRVPSRAVMQRLWLQPPHGGDDLCQLEKRGQGWDMVLGFSKSNGSESANQFPKHAPNPQRRKQKSAQARRV